VEIRRQCDPPQAENLALRDSFQCLKQEKSFCSCQRRKNSL
jgi:hypothetical protein